MQRDVGHGQCVDGEHHREIAHAGAFGEDLGVSRIRQPRGVQTLLVQRGRHDAVRVMGQREVDRGTEEVVSGTTRPRVHLARRDTGQVLVRRMKARQDILRRHQLGGMRNRLNLGGGTDQAESAVQPNRIADDDGAAQRQQVRPCPGDDLRPDAGHVAERKQ